MHDALYDARDGVTVSKPEDFRNALEHAIQANRPYLTTPKVRPPATGTWALPPLAHAEPAFGEPYPP